VADIIHLIAVLIISGVIVLGAVNLQLQIGFPFRIGKLRAVNVRIVRGIVEQDNRGQPARAMLVQEVKGGEGEHQKQQQGKKAHRHGVTAHKTGGDPKRFAACGTELFDPVGQPRGFPYRFRVLALDFLFWRKRTEDCSQVWIFRQQRLIGKLGVVFGRKPFQPCHAAVWRGFMEPVSGADAPFSTATFPCGRLRSHIFLFGLAELALDGAQDKIRSGTGRTERERLTQMFPAGFYLRSNPSLPYVFSSLEEAFAAPFPSLGSVCSDFAGLAQLLSGRSLFLCAN
jgi:hypothetical protein